MTPTQNILNTFLLCSIGGISLLSCAGPIQEGGSYCFNIDEGEECPSLETVNSERLPYEPTCSTIEYLEASDGPVQGDSPITGMEQIADDDMDSCCYTASYREIRSEAECVMGRPLMEEGSAKVAHIQQTTSNPWSKQLPTSIEVHHLSTEQREKVGDFYLTTALYEHASIASFQKFTLDLMRFGAPPHLMDLAQQATRDEIAHARMSFALADAFLQKNIQPSTLDYTPTLCTSLQDFAKSTLLEGAIGETIAVLLASEQLRFAKEPSVQDFLKQVVEDEAKHAELAWETLRWCLQKEPSIRSILMEAMEKLPSFDLSHYPQEAILDLGLPNRDSMQKVIQLGFARVIVPSIQSLLDSSV